MQSKAKQREKLIRLARYAFAIIGGGAMLSFGNFMQLIGIFTGELFLLFVVFTGILVGMTASELPGAVAAGLLAFLTGTLMFFGFILLPLGASASWEFADLLLRFAVDAVVRLTLFSFLALILIGPVIGRIIGPEWYPVAIKKHELKVPIPEKE